MERDVAYLIKLFGGEGVEVLLERYPHEACGGIGRGRATHRPLIEPFAVEEGDPRWNCLKFVRGYVAS